MSGNEVKSTVVTHSWMNAADLDLLAEIDRSEPILEFLSMEPKDIHMKMRL